MTTRVAILHYAAPPIVGGVESTIYHHARLLAGAGYAVTVIAGRGAPFEERVAVAVIHWTPATLRCWPSKPNWTLAG